jgi:hypothetical protein
MAAINHIMFSVDISPPTPSTYLLVRSRSLFFQTSLLSFFQKFIFNSNKFQSDSSARIDPYHCSLRQRAHWDCISACRKTVLLHPFMRFITTKFSTTSSKFDNNHQRDFWIYWCWLLNCKAKEKRGRKFVRRQWYISLVLKCSHLTRNS